MSAPVYRFACGHVGRDNEAPRQKASAFIRIAEVRQAALRDVDKKCPECGKR